ncbi:winged helix-turn-helix transcriptional regulator [Pseudofrankia sp. BMG5.37]|uniref:winged helix-turn-helix transcriptional regulator n=1 Tax=Pseudofrankia sp. BMG5.37 TaxID=3050035 RepID=UPI002895A0F0|nr:winged helix-turn-helix transcriptional regulator [Pseudofrankia sp. BMG5.37]MDT3440964.1 winged helix-turn-helix transcriptional regulator [Pseudofrankia sp. BMG5.37]
MLTRTLRVLEAERYILRATLGDRPVRVEYSLTERGLSLREQLLLLGRWAVDRHESDARTAAQR